MTSAGLAALSILLFPVGLALVVRGLRRTPDPDGSHPPRGVGAGRFAPTVATLRRRRRRVAVAVLAGITLWVATGWAAAAAVVPAAVLVVPVLLTPPAAGTDVERLTALAQWVRSLSGLLAAGAGIEHAIHASRSSAPAPIRPEVSRLSARIRAQMPTEEALRIFADDLDDATGDLVASALALGARRRQGGLASVLEDFAVSVADEVHMRQAVEADRAKPRNTARWVTAISLAVVVVLFALTDYMEPYRDGWGQLLLVILLTGYVASLAWLRRLSVGEHTPRFLVAGGRA